MNLDVSSGSAGGLLALLELRGIGPQAADRLARRFATLAEIRSATPKALEGTVSAPARASLGDSSAWENGLTRAQEILEEAERRQVFVLTAADEQYPDWLRGIPDRPPVLFLKGTLRPGRRYVACIGTREPSRFGEEVSRRMVPALGDRGWSIVSGLALGVDSLSHQAALDSGAHTVAILANGLEAVYPKKNARLAADILSSGGALLSEQPFGTPAIPRNLVQRDRLQSGMSAGTIVMQTDIIGGSMHTVRFTLLQGRLLFTPAPYGPHMDEPKSRGILALSRVPGRELARMLEAEGDYAALLERAFGDRPVATPIAGRTDYEKLFSMLDQVANCEAPPTNAGRNPQLGLF
jgi:DNA processing protein